MAGWREWYFGIWRRLFALLTLCAAVGAVLGMLAGFIIGLIQRPMPVFSSSEILLLGGLVGLLVWIFGLFLLAFLLRYRFGDIALPTLLNAVLTSTVTAFILDILQVPMLGFLVGAVVGVVLGTLLCRLCRFDGRR